MRVLVLDDESMRHDEIAKLLVHCDAWHAYTAERAVEFLGKDFDLVLLDHDLGKGATGAMVAEFISRMPEERRPPRVIVHSWNRDGARSICSWLDSANVWNRWMPFGPRMLDAVKALVSGISNG